MNKKYDELSLENDLKSPYRVNSKGLFIPNDMTTEYRSINSQSDQYSAVDLLSIKDKIVDECKKYTDNEIEKVTDKLFLKIITLGGISVLITIISIFLGWLTTIHRPIEILKEQYLTLTQKNIEIIHRQKLIDEKIDFMQRYIK